MRLPVAAPRQLPRKLTSPKSNPALFRRRRGKLAALPCWRRFLIGRVFLLRSFLAFRLFSGYVARELFYLAARLSGAVLRFFAALCAFWRLLNARTFLKILRMLAYAVALSLSRRLFVRPKKFCGAR